MRTISIRVGFMAAALGAASLFQVFNAPTSLAAPNPESCFTTTGVANRTITDYDFAGVGCGASVEIPSTIAGGTVVSIGGWAFESKGLTSVIIPNSVTSIGTYAFGYNQIASVIIPNSVTSIGDFAFEDNDMTSVTIPSSVTTIGDGAFYTNLLTSVTIPSSVTSIGEEAFSTNLLTSVTIPSSMTSIDRFTFYNNQLTSVTIPSSVTSIGQRAFESNQLTSVTIPSSVTSIGSFAFGTNKLTSVTIPSQVTSVGIGAFSLQSPHGSNIWDIIFGNDISLAQAAADSVWYVQLFTADPSNPQGFIDDIIFEQTELDGQDNDYNEQFYAGGHLVNPTSAQLQFVDGSNNQLLDPITLTGQTSDGTTYFNDYVAINGPNVPFPVSTFSPTLLELQAARTALAQYYRAGSTLDYTAAPVNGVVPIPSSYSFVLGASAAGNQRQFVYAVNDTSQANGQLASTGLNQWLVAAAAGAVIIGSMAVIGKKS